MESVASLAWNRWQLCRGISGNFRAEYAHKSNVTGYFPPEVKKQLRMLAAERDTTIQALLAEAMNDLFAKYGKPEIVPVDVK